MKLTVAQIAERLAVTPTRVRHLIARRRLRAINVNPNPQAKPVYRIGEEDLARFEAEAANFNAPGRSVRAGTASGPARTMQPGAAVPRSPAAQFSPQGQPPPEATETAADSADPAVWDAAVVPEADDELMRLARDLVRRRRRHKPAA